MSITRISEKSRKLICEILETKRVSNGKYVREFEEKFAQLLGAKEAVALSSGTDADILALTVLYDYGAKRGDEIIIPALSFVATGHAVIHAGFKPVFVDIERDTLNIDPAKIREKINPKTRGIIAVSLYGQCADMDPIMKFARKYGLIVVEDAAQAIGTEYRGRRAGSMGDFRCFNFTDTMAACKASKRKLPPIIL